MVGSFNKLFLSGAALALIAYPSWAITVKTEITKIQLNPNKDGFELIFNINGNNQPEISTTNKDNTLAINLANTQLKLSDLNTFQKENPVNGVTSLLVTQLENNNVLISVGGTTSIPTAKVTQQDEKSLTISFSISTNKESNLSANTPLTLPQINQDLKNFNQPLLPTNLGLAQLPDIPCPQTNSQVEEPTFSDINLDEANNQIMRTYQLNEIKATSNAIVAQNLTSIAETGGTVSGSGLNGGSNFNSPFDSRGSSATAQTSIKRTTASTENINYQGAKEFLELLGANNGGTNKANNIASPSLTQLPEQAVPYTFPGQTPGAISRILNGLEIIADSRTNTLTMIGSRRLVEIASVKLKQLDIPIKQVAINIKIIDVNLSKNVSSNVDLQYRASDTIGLGFNGSNGFSANIIGRTALGAMNPVPIAQNFLLNLLTSLQNQSAKILTNPTLVVQAGSSAQVNLTQEIFSGFETIEDTRFGTSQGTVPLRRRPIIRPAGIIVNVSVEQIDHNGFISLDVSPEISAPSDSVFRDQGSEARLLLQRRLETGRVRLRDGQTLLLTGIIQDQDRKIVTKIPILGDIPLLGRLFRSQESINERREVVIVITPQILKSSDCSPFGNLYTPSRDVQNLLKK